MILLRPDQLPDLVASLKNDFPASLNVYFMAKNQVEKRYAWPGVTFVVDSFPLFSACICRTDPVDPLAPPLPNGYSIFMHARDPIKLKNLLDEPDAVDWTQCIGVHGVQRREYIGIVEEKCRSLGGQVAYSPRNVYFADTLHFVGFNLKDINYKYNLPDGFRVGSLGEEHVEQLAREKRYGDPAKNYLFFQYLMREKFPSAAVFDEENAPVAYVLTRPEGCLGAGYVTPEHRSKGFFKVVCYELLKELERQGEEIGYADIWPGNPSSPGAMLAIGGFMYPDFAAASFEFIPKSQIK